MRNVEVRQYEAGGLRYGWSYVRDGEEVPAGRQEVCAGRREVRCGTAMRDGKKSVQDGKEVRSVRHPLVGWLWDGQSHTRVGRELVCATRPDSVQSIARYD